MNYKWEVLAEEMLATGRYHAPRVTPRLLSKHYHAGRAVIRESGDWGTRKVHAYLAFIKTQDPWYIEIASAYVSPEHCGNGIFRAMMRELAEKFPRMLVDSATTPVRTVPATPFLITSNPSVAHVALDEDFRAVTKFNMPNVVEWAERIGLDNRLPSTATRDDPHHSPHEERWLYMR